MIARRRLDREARSVAAVNATTTANAATISGYTVNVLYRNGAVSEIAAQAKVAGPGALILATSQYHISAAAHAAQPMSATTTPQYPLTP